MEKETKQAFEENVDKFLSGVRTSLVGQATRKGYHVNGIDVASGATQMMGVAMGHAIGEITYKLLEFKTNPRRVVAEKISGWAYQLWRQAPED